MSEFISEFIENEAIDIFPKKFVVHRGNLADTQSRGWLRVAPTDSFRQGDFPSEEFTQEFYNIRLDSHICQESAKAIDGENPIKFSGELALREATVYLEGEYYRSGHRLGKMSVVGAGPNLDPDIVLPLS